MYKKLYVLNEELKKENDLCKDKYVTIYNDYYKLLETKNNLKECLISIKNIITFYVANIKMSKCIYKNNIEEPVYILEKILNNTYDIYYYQKNEKELLIEMIDKNTNKIITIKSNDYCKTRDNLIQKLKKLILH